MRKVNIIILLVLSCALGNFSQIERASGVTDAIAVRYAQVSVTDNYGCALLTDGSVTCADSTGNASSPVSTLTSESIAVSGTYALKVVVQGRGAGCALLSDHTITCWNLPSPPAYSDFIDVQSGMCGLRQSGQIACWAPFENAPTNYDSSFTYTSLSSSWNTDRCALTNANAIKCLGYWDHSYGSVPTFTAPVVQISAGRSSECAVDASGLMKCWAGSLFGTLNGVKQVSIGESVGCYVNTSNQVACQYVSGGLVNWMSPTSSMVDISSISVGSGEACGITTSGQIRCWGPYAPNFPVVKVAPSAPTIDTPTIPGPGQLTWTWSATSDGGSPITSYTWSGACSGSGNVNTVTCSGLTGGTNYTLNVTATNVIGTSVAGSSSLTMPVAPSAPTMNTPTSSGLGQLTWTWSATSDGGSPITSYTWSGACSGSGNVLTVTCSGLSGGRSYTLNVTATNQIGVSAVGSSSLTLPSNRCTLFQPGADLSSCDLSNVELSNLDLSGVNFSYSNLSGAKFNFANLANANFQSALMNSVSMISADLTGANLSSTSISYGNFTSANLSNANLNGAWLAAANFTQSNLFEATVSGTYFTSRGQCIRSSTWYHCGDPDAVFSATKSGSITGSSWLPGGWRLIDGYLLSASGWFRDGGVLLQNDAPIAYLSGVAGYGMGNPSNLVAGSQGAQPDTGFVTIFNQGTGTFNGQMGFSAISPCGGDFSRMFDVTLAPGASLSFQISNESSNVGGFNGTSCGDTTNPQNGAKFVVKGVSTLGSISIPVDHFVFDKDLNYVLQGSSPFGQDLGDDVEVSAPWRILNFLPSAPKPLTVDSPSSPASGQLTWTWSPNGNGGSPITSYTWSGACSGSGNVTSVTCTGLTGGTNYTLNITATNALGISAPSSSTLMATTEPFAPTVNSPSSPASGQLTWTWSPNGNGGSPITGYTWSGACSGSGTVTSVTCTGLTGGSTYSLNVTATNAVGTSSAGSSTLTATTEPLAPTVSSPTRPGSGQLTWTWSPSATGGSPITSYTWSGACSGSGNVTSVTCSGLTGGTNYTLNVTATNAVGTSSAGSSSLVATSIPNAPTVNTPTRPGSGQLAWTWSPNSDGGSPITSYTWSGACSGSGNLTTVTCNGLTGGTNYTLNVTATNAVGTSSASSSSLLATSIPAAPTVNAPSSPASGQLTWTWSPNSSGGSAITSYSWTGACSGSGLVTTVTCSGLTGGTNYTLSVTATNGVGTSGSGSRSGIALTIPSAPIVNASPANGALSVTWAAPSSNGGTAITGYTATATTAGNSYSCTSTTLSCAITGLTNGTTYSVSVVATNAQGNSSASNVVSIYPAPDTKFLAYSPNAVVLVKSNFQVLVANAKAGALVTVATAGATKTCTANAVGECSVTLNSSMSSGWVIVASYIDGKKTVSTSGSYRVNIANVTVSSVQIAKGKSFTVKIASGGPGTKFQVVASSGTTYSVTLTSSGAGTITVATKAKGPLTLSISDNGILLQTTTVAVV